MIMAEGARYYLLSTVYSVCRLLVTNASLSLKRLIVIPSNNLSIYRLTGHSHQVMRLLFLVLQFYCGFMADSKKE